MGGYFKFIFELSDKNQLQSCLFSDNIIQYRQCAIHVCNFKSKYNNVKHRNIWRIWIIVEGKPKQKVHIMDSSGSELLKLLKTFTSGMKNNSLVDNQMKSLNSSHGLDRMLGWETKASNLSGDAISQSYNDTLR